MGMHDVDHYKNRELKFNSPSASNCKTDKLIFRNNLKTIDMAL